MSKILGVVLVACYIIAIALPFLSFGSLFKLIPLTLLQIALLIGITAVYLCANELAKKFVFARK